MATAARDGELTGYNGYLKQIAGQYPGLKDLINGIFRQADSGIDFLEQAGTGMQCHPAGCAVLVHNAI